MVFKFYETTKRDDLAIVNAGVNYTNSTKYRSDMMVDFAEPIWLKDYIDLYQEHDRKAINKLTKDIKTGLQERVVHIAKEADDDLVNSVLDIHRNSRKTTVFPILEDNFQPLKEEIEIAQKINELAEEEKGDLQKNVTNYFEKLKTAKVEDEGVAKPNFGHFGNLLFLILGAIPAILGYLLNALPIRLADNKAHKMADGTESLASLRPALGMIAYFLYFLILLLIVAIFGNKWWFLGLFSMPFLGYFYIMWDELGQKWGQARSFLKLKEIEQKEILEARKKVLTIFAN